MSEFASIEKIIQDAREGKMYILVDSEDRENEGDLIIPGSACEAKHINFMATHGRGLICLSISESRATELKLPLMNPDNWKKKTTAFTVSALNQVTFNTAPEDKTKVKIFLDEWYNLSPTTIADTYLGNDIAIKEAS